MINPNALSYLSPACIRHAHGIDNGRGTQLSLENLHRRHAKVRTSVRLGHHRLLPVHAEITPYRRNQLQSENA